MASFSRSRRVRRRFIARWGRARLWAARALIACGLLAPFGPDAAAQVDSASWPPPPTGERRTSTARARREPSLAQVIDAAVAASRLDLADRLDSRARWSALLPNLRVTVRRGLTQDASATADDRWDRQTLSTDHELSLEFSATVQLDRLLYQDDSVALARLRADERAERRDLVTLVTRFYVERRMLTERRAADGQDTTTARLRIRELTGLLDAFTDGAFGRMMARETRGPPR